MKTLENQLRKVEEEIRLQVEALCYPNGREAAFQRIDAMCSIHTMATAPGGIDRSPGPMWRSATE